MQKLTMNLFDDRALEAEQNTTAGIPSCKTLCYTGPVPAQTGCITNYGCKPTDLANDFGY